MSDFIYLTKTDGETLLLNKANIIAVKSNKEDKCVDVVVAITNTAWTEYSVTNYVSDIELKLAAP